MTVRDKVIKIIYSIIIIFFGVLVGLILLNNIIFGGIDYLFNQNFVFNNIITFILAIIVISIGYLIYKHSHIKINNKLIYILSIGLLVVQIFVFYNILFITHTWDAGTVLAAARDIVDGNVANVNYDYFSQFPNNIWILTIITCIVRVANGLGIESLQYQLLAIVIIQSVLSTLTGLLVARIVEKESNSNGYAFCSWIIYVILVGLSAQAIIPYTDMMSLIFPVLIYRIYQTLDNNKLFELKCFVIVVLSYIGFKIKPTVIIIFVAIVAVECVNWIVYFKKDNLVRTLKVIGLAIAAILVGVLLSKCTKYIIGFEPNPELNNGALHMLMMGVNDESNGTINVYDVNTSNSITDKSQRSEVQLQTIKERVANRGLLGNARFYAKKSLMTFNDGTFAVGQEGGYYDEVFPDKIPVISSWLKSWFYQGGKGFVVSSQIQQLVWMLILILCTAAVLIQRNKKNAIVVLSLIGIIIFNLLFEARGRYLFNYVPVFILVATISIRQLYIFIDN